MKQRLALLGGTAIRTAPFPTWPIFGAPEEQALLHTLHSAKWGKLDGDEVATFEKRFADYIGVKHAIAVCNGTISLRIALMAAGMLGKIAAGDEVIVPPYTFLATATAVVEANATPVFADIDRQTFNVTVESIEQAITPRTRAIIPVHLGGMPCDIGAIQVLAKQHDLTVIEDAAHAHGSEYKAWRCGALGHLASFSFQSTKNLTSGEGGIITTDDDALAAACRSIHNCGRIEGGAWYEHHVMSGNYRLGEFAGAILNCQLDRLDEQTDRRDHNGSYLNERLSKIPGITPQRRDEFVTRNAHHLYLFRYDANVWSIPRDRFIDALVAEGIPVSSGYRLPLYKQPLFANRTFGPYTGCTGSYRDVHLPNVEAICGGEGAWLPQNVLLGSRGDMDDIVAAFEKVYEQRSALTEVPR
jgi:dTDP-4-amino-4,6-dideoxygalactose transaminase